MATGTTIVFDGVTKRFGDVDAVHDLSFEVRPGRVTGFLGPNGAGKTTSLRILLGLVSATSGTATIGGETYVHLREPMRSVGSTLEVSFHPGRTGRGHLAVVSAASGIPRSRIPEVLAAVGMAGYADRRIGGYSLGMRQRLGLATALLGDPGVLVLDEPINGLDPEGIRWMRELLRHLADEGRTILVSSHLLTEVQQTVDDVVVIAGGRQRYTGELSGLARSASGAPAAGTTTIVDAPDRAALVAALTSAGLAPLSTPEGLVVTGPTPDQIGRITLAAGVALSSLGARRTGGLEDDFLALVSDPAPSGDGDLHVAPGGEADR